MRRPYHHGAVREAVLTAAGNIIERAGVKALTLRGAAREAGVSPAALNHHFGDLSGLLSEVAADGFARFHARLRASGDAAGSEPRARLVGMCHGYVGFARDSPALFLLMFRSDSLDWSRPALAAAGADAFALLMDQRAETPRVGSDATSLAPAIATWSLAHGLSMLLIDGRLGPIMERISGPAVEILVEAVLSRVDLVGPDIRLAAMKP